MINYKNKVYTTISSIKLPVNNYFEKKHIVNRDFINTYSYSKYFFKKYNTNIKYNLVLSKIFYNTYNNSYSYMFNIIRIFYLHLLRNNINIYKQLSTVSFLQKNLYFLFYFNKYFNFFNFLKKKQNKNNQIVNFFNFKLQKIKNIIKLNFLFFKKVKILLIFNIIDNYFKWVGFENKKKNYKIFFDYCLYNSLNLSISYFDFRNIYVSTILLEKYYDFLISSKINSKLLDFYLKKNNIEIIKLFFNKFNSIHNKKKNRYIFLDIFINNLKLNYFSIFKVYIKYKFKYRSNINYNKYIGYLLKKNINIVFTLINYIQNKYNTNNSFIENIYIPKIRFYIKLRTKTVLLSHYLFNYFSLCKYDIFSIFI